MMPEHPTPRLSLGDLARQALAADPITRAALVLQLARGTRTAELAAGIADLLLAGDKRGQSVALEWLARVRPVVPSALIARFIPLLADKAVTSPVRIAAAARLIRDLPDKIEVIRPVVKSLTTGLSPLRTLERLRQLQHQVDKGGALDALIERREQRVKMDCPRCGVRLVRIEMVKHLWFVHRVFLDRGKVREAQALVADARSAYAAGGDPEAMDRAVLLSGTNLDGLRTWVAGSNPTAEDTSPLRAEAEEQQAGLCPGCYSHLPEAVPSLPPPLNLVHGRLTGDGYLVEVGGTSWFRTLQVETPDRVLHSGLDRRRFLGPRGMATIAALPVLLAGAALASFFPSGLLKPMQVIVCCLVVSVLAYLAVLLYRRPLPSPADRAIDAAWSVLARRLVQRDRAFHYLTRLCLTSLGRGNPVERVSVVARAIGFAEESAAESDAAVQLAAASRILQALDEGRSRDRAAVVAGLAAAGFQGVAIGAKSASPYTRGPALRGGSDFSEHVVGCFLTTGPDEGELARLRILLLSAAFDAGLRPRTLIDLWNVAPNLRRAMAVEPLYMLGLLYGVWGIRNSRKWERVAAAETVFEFCRSNPGESKRLLQQYPDLLLVYRPDPDTESDLGLVLICRRGVFIGQAMVADPDAGVRLVKFGSGGYELQFGKHRFGLARRPTDDIAELLRGWLRFRAAVLLPYIDGYREPGSPEVSDRVLTPFRLRCGRCGTVSVVAVGKVGTPVAAS